MKARTVRVGELAEQVRGVSYAKHEASSEPGPNHMPVLRAGNITDAGLLFDDLVFVPRSRVTEKQKIRRGDVVIAASSGSLDVVGKAAAATADLDAGFGAFCKVLRPSGRVHPGYFAHFFRTKSYRQRVSTLAAGANINNLRNEHLDDLELPLPTLDKQQRIADVLDRAEALRAKRRATLARLDELRDATFVGMFGDLNERWRWPAASLQEVVRETKLGLVRGASELGAKHPFPYVRMNAITHSGELDLSSLQRTYATAAELESNRLESGDLLFNTRNSEELVGKTALYSGDGTHLFNNNLMRIRFNENAVPEFIVAAFRTPYIRRELNLRKSGTTNVFAIYYKDLRTLPLPLPPVRLQQDFRARTGAIERLKIKHRTSLREMDALFVSLQHRAFCGEL